MKVLFLNGPRSSGKDTIASAMRYYGRSNLVMMKFASPIADSLMGMFQIPKSVWNAMYVTGIKERPNNRLDGMSPREAMIWLSEDIIKPRFGKEFFGRIAAKLIKDMDDEELWNKVFVFSDSGFAYEIASFIDELKISPDDVYLANIHREGCNFVGDSRSYVMPDECGIPRANWYIIENNDTVDALEPAAAMLYHSITAVKGEEAYG